MTKKTKKRVTKFFKLEKELELNSKKNDTNLIEALCDYCKENYLDVLYVYSKMSKEFQNKIKENFILKRLVLCDNGKVRQPNTLNEFLE